MNRAYYSDTIKRFLDADVVAIVGQLSAGSPFDVTPSQMLAWEAEIRVMKGVLRPYAGRGKVYFEWQIPRLGGRIDVLAVIESVVFVLEFKVGARGFAMPDIDQVCDYALDLKHFHETSHSAVVAPILVATGARDRSFEFVQWKDKLLRPVKTNERQLAQVIEGVLKLTEDEPIHVAKWEKGRYSPTPTIIEATRALYAEHRVEDISRSDADGESLQTTSQTIDAVIREAEKHSRKSICFVTGVPGAGKTLVGLNIAVRHKEEEKSNATGVFLSGNGPLVQVLSEALARDRWERKKRETAKKTSKVAKPRLGDARREAKAFIQNVHHFRDECLQSGNTPPHEHVTIFDEAQRAWNLDRTRMFMKQKKKRDDFDWSEPEYLISCLDRHDDWAVIICLVGGGQEINRGEAGIGEWIKAIMEKYPDWHVHISPKLSDTEYTADGYLGELRKRTDIRVVEKPELHLSVSMRSFRAEKVSQLVKELLDLDDGARQTIKEICGKYPIKLTRNLSQAKAWLREQARGSERYGMLVSSNAKRLKPYAIDIRPDINPAHWFLHGKDDVRSSYYLEDVATEFETQGLEIDWACLIWDADFRYAKATQETPSSWSHWNFCSSRWNRVLQEANREYQKNAYRVLLTRARQGMVIVVPEGDDRDGTRQRAFYDPTYNYLDAVGFEAL